MEINYPRQVASIKRKQITEKGDIFTTLGIDMKLFVPNDDSDTPPMEIYAPYSVYVATIVSVMGDKKVYPKANIPTKDVHFIKQKTDWCNTQLWEYLYNKDNSSEPMSPAYTVKLTGKYNQYTAAQYLLEKGENGIQDLKAHGNWLFKNGSAKYKKLNDLQIEAIKEAISLFQEGNLVKTSIGTEIVVYDSGIKFFKNEQDNGLTRCYNIKIVFNKTSNYPYRVNIMNSYNSIRTMPDKTVRVGNEMKNVSHANIDLSANEWTGIITILSDRMFQFETCMFNRQKKIMDEISWKAAN